MKIKWVSEDDNSIFKAYVNGYYLLVTYNGVSLFWGVYLDDLPINSSFHKNHPKPKTIKEAQETAENAYLEHYTKDLVFPIDF